MTPVIKDGQCSLEVCLELKCSISVLDNLYEQSALHIAAEADPQMIPVLLEAQTDILPGDEVMEQTRFLNIYINIL